MSDWGRAVIGPNEPAPDFTLPDQLGRPVRLADQRGGWVVLWWYPEAGSEGCSVQATSMRGFDARQATVLGISFNSPAENDRFSCDQELGFPLLSDVDRSVGTAYGVTRAPDEPFADKPRRATFLIDPEGRVVFSEVVPPEAVHGYADRALRQLQAAQRGE